MAAGAGYPLEGLKVLDFTALFDHGDYRAASGNYTLANWDVDPDGESFLMLRRATERIPSTHINAVVNFFEELKRLFPDDG